MALEPHIRKRLIAFGTCALLAFLGGCGPKAECDAFETRDAVLKSVSNDHNNALGKFAATNSTAKQPSAGTSETEAKKAKQPLYLLGEKIITTSTSTDKRTLGCSGAISVIVGDTKATKEIEFNVQQLFDGKISVSVKPFEF
jgi:hypothetical protein